MFSRVLITVGIILMLGGGFLWAQEAVAPSELVVEEMTFCAGVEEREPVGEAAEFTTEVGRVWCWTVIVGATDSTSITHKWYWDGENVANVELEVKYPRMRTWSCKTITSEMAGIWKVEVVDPHGEILKEMSCTVKPPLGAVE